MSSSEQELSPSSSERSIDIVIQAAQRAADHDHDINDTIVLLIHESRTLIRKFQNYVRILATLRSGGGCDVNEEQRQECRRNIIAKMQETSDVLVHLMTVHYSLAARNKDRARELKDELTRVCESPGGEIEVEKVAEIRRKCTKLKTEMTLMREMHGLLDDLGTIVRGTETQ